MSEENKNSRNDVAEFFIGLAMLCVGVYLFTQNVEVITGNIFALDLFGHQMDGLVFVPLIASIIFLFYKYNTVSKICCVLSFVLILANVIMNLRLYWRPTSLYALVVIFILLFGGSGLVLRALFANPEGKHGKNYKE